MPELLLSEIIKNPLSREELRKVKSNYLDLLKKQPFPEKIGTDYPSVLSILKRDRLTIGPYTDISIFEAANRIATDLTLIEGVLYLFEKKLIGASATVRILLGTMQEKNKGDFSIFENESETQGEAFDVAPSFFVSKLYKTLKKWKGRSDLKFIIFNQNCLDDSSCTKYLKHQESAFPDISFFGVYSWQN